MRGVKRRVAAVSTAASKGQPAVNDGILDVANRKGIRCCVECGATSTPQWREGPMGPKTLCNACGVRRQRLLRKQQATAVANLPTVPVAVAQARRRLPTRATVQATSLPADDSHLEGTASASEHSSDDTELEWAANAHSAFNLRRNHPQQQPQLQQQQQQLLPEVEESCNEEESAAYDLLFFAGVGGGPGALSANVGVGAEDEAAPGSWRGTDYHHHGHNTRRHVQPMRRPDDFYYYGDGPEEPVASVGTEGVAGNKRRRLALAATASGHRPRHQRVGLAGPSFSSSEDAADSRPHFVHPASTPGARDHDFVRRYMAAAPPSISDLLPPKPTQREPHSHTPSHAHPSDQPTPPAAPAVTSITPSSLACSSAAPTLVGPIAPSLPTVADNGACSATVAAATAAVLPFSPYANPFFALPVALPLPSMSAHDLEVLAHIQREFQRAFLQMHQTNAACEAVGAVMAEQREAAAAAREAATAASQQLASEVRSMADQYRLRDVLAELHSAMATAVAPGQADVKAEVGPEGEAGVVAVESTAPVAPAGIAGDPK